MHPVHASHHARRIIAALGLPLLLILMSGVAAAGPSRDQAIQLVLDTFVYGSPDESTTVVFLYHRDLPDSLLLPGTIVSDHEGTVERFIDSPSFFFFIDRETQYMWSHAATFVIVDPVTGAMDSISAGTWPVLNGLPEERFLPLGNASPDIVFGQYPVGIDPIEYTPVATGTSGSWAVIAVGFPEQAGDAGIFEKEAARAKRMLNGMASGPHVDASHISTIGINAQGAAVGATPEEICSVLEHLAANCDKLYFTYIGHGLESGKAVTRGKDLSWEKLAEKLIATGAKEFCVTLVACYSGSAIPAFAKAEVKVNGKPRKFKGSIVTSSSEGKPTHVTGESPFAKALEACYQDPAADLDGSGKVTDVEATAWAQFMNEKVAKDKPQGKVIGDNGSTVVKPPMVKKRESGADEGGTLEFEKVKFEFEVTDLSGAKTTQCRQRLYIRNNTTRDHKAKRSVTIWCVNKSVTPATRDSVAAIVPAAKAGERVCVARLPDKCESIEITKGAKVKVKAQLPSVAGAVETLAGPVETLADLTNTLDRGAVYGRGESIFFDLLVPGIPGQSYVTAVDPVPGWDTGIGPASFTISALLDSEVVVVRGVVPDTATAGAWMHAMIVNATLSDTTIYRVHALLYDSLAAPIGGGDVYRHRYLESPLGMSVTGGLARIEDSAIRVTGPASCTVEPGGDLRILRSVVQPDSGGTSGFAARGHLEADYTAWINLVDGLRLQSASGRVFDCAVIGSGGDGVTVTGSQALMSVDFLTVEGSAANGLVLDNATNCLLQNVNIEGSGAQDVVIRNHSHAQLRDCTYDRTRETLVAGSTLQRTWSTAFAITTHLGDAVGGAEVEVVDALGQTVLLQTTNAQGFTDLVPLVEYIRLGIGTIARTPHTVRVTAFGEDRFFTYAADATRIQTLVVTDSTSTDTGGEKPPARFLLAQNEPNPFSAGTVITFELPEPAAVHLRLFDVRGALVAVLAEGRFPAGRHRLPWRPEGLPRGVYFYLLEAGAFREARKLVVE